ncbi:hypothetical protein Hte_008233 [Hypoxylon texense]
MSGPVPDTSQPADTAAYHTTPGSATIPPPCECWPATLRIATLCQTYSQASSSSPPSTSSPTGREVSATTADVPSPPRAVVLADTLAVAHNLVQHWGTVNGCASADAHMDARMLCCMVDSIGIVLRDHETAIANAAAAAPPPRTSVGRLELDAAEAAIVAQEALKHSLIRLTVMLQDVEEEAAWLGRRADGESARKKKNPLGDRDVKGLITRLFRMLGNVNRLETAEKL